MPPVPIPRGPVPWGPTARAAVRAGVAALTLAARLGAQPAPAADTTRTSLTGVALSAPQQAALRGLAGRTQGALTALYAQSGARSGAPMPLAVRASFDSVVAAHNLALRALLTDEQRTVFDGNVRAVAAVRRARRRRPGTVPPTGAAPRAAAATSAAPHAGAPHAGAPHVRAPHAGARP